LKNQNFRSRTRRDEGEKVELTACLCVARRQVCEHFSPTDNAIVSEMAIFQGSLYLQIDVK
jgi:hypothetical protein